MYEVDCFGHLRNLQLDAGATAVSAYLKAQLDVELATVNNHTAVQRDPAQVDAGRTMAHNEQGWLFEPRSRRVGLKTPALRRLHRGACRANDPQLARSRSLVKLDSRTKIVFTRAKPDHRRPALRSVCAHRCKIRHCQPLELY